MRQCNTFKRGLILLLILSTVVAFQPSVRPGNRGRSFLRKRSSDLLASESGDSDEAPPSLKNEDWRAFRAKLVLGNQGDDSPSSTWAYDSGSAIEPGSIILAKVEPDFCYFGLNQQYFHKSVMLVTYHKENEFTKGIILNRPTNLFLNNDDFLDEDDEPFWKDDGNGSTENSWRIWFGGDVRGLYSDDTEILCLHSIDTDLGRNVSEVLLNNIMMTSYEGAIQLINAQEAEEKDFWTFAGYAGWTGGQLLDELNRESWTMVSADADTVWSELERQRDDRNSDPRDAGIKTWYSLMKLIGKEDEAKSHSESFADLTLKEWCRDEILFNPADENTKDGSKTLEAGGDQLSDILSSFSAAPDTVDKIVKLAARARDGLAGCILRGSPTDTDRSPFLLSNQKFHKSTILLLQDDHYVTVGVMLNHPTTKTRPITLPDGRSVELPVRYGGQFGIPGVAEQPTIFLHAKPKLKKLSVGESVGRSDDDDDQRIWICTEEQAIKAIADKNASHRDFMCIEGFCTWYKEEGGEVEGGISGDILHLEGGILGDILGGKFDLVDNSFLDEIWVTLLAQKTLSLDTLDLNCRLTSDAWGVAGKPMDLFPRTVYESSITVSELSDDALRYWIEAFLLGGVISAAGKYSGFE